MRAIERLSDAKIRKAKPQSGRKSELLADGGNLYLQVTLGREGNVRRSWIFRYKRPGHPIRDMGLGAYGTVGLADARDLARGYRRLLADGIDPIKHRDDRVAANLAASGAVMTFEAAAEAYIRQHAVSWRSPAHAAQWPSTMKTYVYPIIGKLSVAAVDTPHVLKVLQPIWNEKPETANRVRGRIEAVLGWATASKHRAGDNPARWRGHLSNLLPAKTKIKPTQHQKALPYAEMPAFFGELRKRQAIGARALEFLVLTCVRTSDVRQAKWDQIDLKEKVWTIPEFSKTHKEHRVPLSETAVTVLEEVKKISSGIGGNVAKSEFVFPNDITGAALSTNALLALIARMGRKGQMTGHGCRSTFRDWALEQTNFPWELAEMSLGHTVGTKVECAYVRGDAREKRREIMQAWADYCGKPKGGDDNVVPIWQRSAS